jgi:SAM-dependent methyltransferase
VHRPYTRAVATERYARERAFHDILVEGATRSADRFYIVNQSSSSYYRDLLLQEAKRASQSGPPRILELGSGAGAYSSRALAAAGYASLGIDLSESSVRAAIQRARAEFPEIPLEYREMNAEQLEFHDDSFDLVCGTGVIHHLDLERAYSEAARVLRPGGAALFAEPLGHNPLINAYRRLTPEQRTDDEHPLKLDDIRLAERYFGRVEMRFFHLFVLAATPLAKTRAFEVVRRTLDRLDNALFATVAPARRLAWQVVLRLTVPGAGS